MYGYAGIVYDLIIAGADINSQNNEGATSLMFGKYKILFMLSF
jgi:hypothetical protein